MLRTISIGTPGFTMAIFTDSLPTSTDITATAPARREQTQTLSRGPAAGAAPRGRRQPRDGTGGEGRAAPPARGPAARTGAGRAAAEQQPGQRPARGPRHPRHRPRRRAACPGPARPLPPAPAAAAAPGAAPGPDAAAAHWRSRQRRGAARQSRQPARPHWATSRETGSENDGSSGPIGWARWGGATVPGGRAEADCVVRMCA